MYSDKESHRKDHAGFIYRKQKTIVNKTLYDSSMERMVNKNDQIVTAEKGMNQHPLENYSDESIQSSVRRCSGTTPTFKSVVQLVQREYPKDLSHSLADPGHSHDMKQLDEHSKPEDGSSLTADGGVPKRCLGESMQDAESTVVKTKKKKHKRHDVVSSTTISVKVISSSGIVSEEETRTKKHKKSIKSRSREEFFQSLVESKKNVETYRCKDDDKHDRQKERLGTQKASFSKSSGPSSSQPSSTLPLQHPETSGDEDDQNNEQASQPNAGNKARSDPRQTKNKSGSSLQRSSSASSISSTSTTASTASSVASSVGSFTYRKSTSRKKSKKTSKKTVVTFKTAKHLHKSRKGKDGGGSGDSGSADRESNKHSKEMSSSDRPHGDKAKPGMGKKGPDTAVILSHIRKAFSNSCTESDPDGSPIKTAFSTNQDMKSLATKIRECADSLTNMTGVVEGQRVKDEKPIPTYVSNVGSPKHPCTEHIYRKPVERVKSATKSDECVMEESNTIAKESPKASQHLDFHNTTYQLNEKETSPPVSSLAQVDDLTHGIIPLPKQLTSTSANSSKTDVEASASQPVTDYKKIVGTLVDYNMESGELTSEDSEDESWKKMVNEITKENNDSQWNYVVDSQKQRLCVEGTTYASPPIPWRTNWHWHDGAMRSTSPQPPFDPPALPRLPRPPTILYPPPPRVQSSNTLYQQASQKMYNPTTAASPFLWQNRFSTPPVASPWRPNLEENTNWAMKTLQGPYIPKVDEAAHWRTNTFQGPYKPRADEDTNWRIKRREQDNEKDDNDSDDSCCSGEYQAMTSYQHQQSFTGYRQRNLPPRLARLEQEKQKAYTEYHSPTPLSYSQIASGGYQASQGTSAWTNYTSSGPTHPIASTPQQSWSARKSLSPGTPSFEYDTSDVLFPYSMRDYIDTHCHIDFLYQRLNFKGTFQKFSLLHHFPPNYAGCVAVFCTPQSVAQYGIWNDLLKEEKIWGAFGIHPHHAKYYNGRIEENILRCMKHSKAVAYGEIGLDYSSRNDSDRILQQEVFRRQLSLALKMEKPLVIHSRDAEEDTIEIMASMVPTDYKIHRHCFTGTPEEAERWLSVFPKSFIGLTALVTFPSAIGTHRTAAEISLGRLLLETDAPYFLPRQCPRSIKYANPSMAVFVAERIARLRGITTDEVLIAVRKNTRTMYGV